MADVFISYKSDDREDAERLAFGVRKFGVSVWWDYATQTGDVFRQEMARQFQNARVCVALWSRASMESAHVQRESIQADEQGKLIALALDDFSWSRAPQPIWNLAHHVANADWDEPRFWDWMRRTTMAVAQGGIGKSRVLDTLPPRLTIKTPMEVARSDVFDTPIADALSKVAKSPDMARLMYRRRTECGVTTKSHLDPERFGQIVHLGAIRPSRALVPASQVYAESYPERSCIRSLTEVLETLQDPPRPPNRATMFMLGDEEEDDALVRRYAGRICKPPNLPILKGRSSIYAIKDASGDVASLGVLDHGNPKILEFYPFSVELRARGFGYSAVLANAMRVIAFRLNRPLRAWVGADNAQSRILLKRIGWEEDENPRKLRHSLHYLLNGDAKSWCAVQAQEHTVSRAGRWLLDALKQTQLVLPKGLSEQDIVASCGPRTPPTQRAGKS